MAIREALTFEEWPGESVTVTLSPLSMRAYFDFLSEWAGESTYDEFRSQVGTFVGLAQPEWTMPGEVFEDLDFALIRGVINGWVQAVKRVPSPLPAASSGPIRSREASTPAPVSRSARRRSSRTPAPSI